VDVLLVNTRGDEGREHWSAGAARALGATLVAEGHDVRWLCARAVAEDPNPGPGVDCRVVDEPCASFRSVAARVSGSAVDTQLTHWLRERPADRVHVLGVGAPGSAVAPWIAERMGSVVSAAVLAAEVLCHRQDLQHPVDGPCAEWDDPSRCTTCCLQTMDGWASVLARGLGWLGGVSPFPNPLGFANRLETVLGALSTLGAVRVATEADRERLVAAGLTARSVEVGALDALPPVSVRRTRE